MKQAIIPPSSYEVKDWIQATKTSMITGYINPMLAAQKEEHPFTRDDFIKDLRKVSSKVKK